MKEIEIYGDYIQLDQFLKKENIFEVDDKKESIIRLVTDYRTNKEDIRGFISSLKKWGTD